MANKKRTKEDYPIIKYRIVDGLGYTLVKDGKNKLKEALKYSFNFAKEHNDKRFEPQYVVKVTEEYIKINELDIDGLE